MRCCSFRRGCSRSSSYYAQGHIGENVFLGRFVIVWAVLYLTFFLGSKRKIVQGILFAVAAIASVVGI